jgi:hypothetical protein
MFLTGSLYLCAYLLPQKEAPKKVLDNEQVSPDAVAPATEEYAPTEDVPKGNPGYYFDDELMLWQTLSNRRASEAQEMPGHIAVSSYNVLTEFSWPPSPARYPLLIRNILSKQAVADILILQKSLMISSLTFSETTASGICIRTCLMDPLSSLMSNHCQTS